MSACGNGFRFVSDMKEFGSHGYHIKGTPPPLILKHTQIRKNNFCRCQAWSQLKRGEQKRDELESDFWGVTTSNNYHSQLYCNILSVICHRQPNDCTHLCVCVCAWERERTRWIYVCTWRWRTICHTILLTWQPLQTVHSWQSNYD